MGVDRREAIEQLFVQYGRGVGSYVMARVGDADLAEEITARVFLTVVRRFGQCRGSAVGWLWAIVRSELARHFRGPRRPDPLSDEVVDPADGPPERAERREMHLRMRTALEALSDGEHEIVYMKFFLQLRNKEIAEAMGMTASNVGVKVHRALKRLHEMLETEPTRQIEP